jgi:hypothetical protein
MLSSRAKKVSLALLVTLAGCSSSGSGGGGTVALADFGSELAKVSCHRIYTCCDTTERADNTSWGPTEADCVTAMTTNNPLASLQAGIDAGKIVYHGDRAKLCLDHMAALSCTDWGINFNMRYVPDCGHITDGTVAMSAACASDAECVSGFCSLSVCAARGALGDACTSPTACQDGLYCPVSAGDHCATAAAVGAACEVSVSCQNNSCVIPDLATSGTCGSPMTCNGV